MKFNKMAKTATVAMLVVLTLSTAIGCSSKSGDTAYNEIDAAKTEKLIGETKKTLVIDVRGADAYEKGHITNAINIPFDEFEGRISELEHYKNETIVIVCNTGNKSGKAAQMLIDNGFKKVNNAADGMDEHDYATVTYTNIIGSELEKKASEDKDAVILDLRDAKDFEKSHMENAINISMDEFEAKMKEELKDKNQEILLYCNTGTRTAEASKTLQDNGYTNVVNSVDGTKEYEFNFTK